MIILFEDNHLIIVDKPAGLPTQVSLDHKKALETKLKAFIKKRDKKEGNVYLHAVHRLDKEVSGIVIFAKTSKALSRMQEHLRNGLVEKLYQAEVEGVLAKSSSRLINYLVKKPHRSVVYKQASKEAKKAELTYRVLRQEGNRAFLEIKLITGRYHQIRVQLSHLGHPVIGDSKYGSSKQKSSIALKHIRVSFPHIITKEKMTVTLDAKMD
ncbi:RNA pseudouridine synthase [Candidatus Aerophobetes bacterium]|uniref:RNA pseudouridine synthase n=1 Tax=Aerophobetes bacterium TaxID=2030807 RepID=A0A2A4YH30_UNCAE|nr:MAG: RNA pseudouridine synthase [Candidatus Aerophobetes bacterium]